MFALILLMRAILRDQIEWWCLNAVLWLVLFMSLNNCCYGEQKHFVMCKILIVRFILYYTILWILWQHIQNAGPLRAENMCVPKNVYELINRRWKKKLKLTYKNIITNTLRQIFFFAILVCNNLFYHHVGSVTWRVRNGALLYYYYVCFNNLVDYIVLSTSILYRYIKKLSRLGWIE